MKRWLPALWVLAACQLLGGDDPVLHYTVARGDTLFVIARDHHVTVDELRLWNGLTGDLIEVDQVLEIRTTGSSAPPAEAAARPSERPAGRASSRSRAVRDTPGPGRRTHVMPAARECLPPPDVTSDEGMAASEGLDPAGIRHSVDAWLPEVIQCVDEVPSGTAQLAFRVGCDGRVQSVSFSHDPGWPSELRACVRETFGYASFPAHGLPDGDTFTVPLSFGP